MKIVADENMLGLEPCFARFGQIERVSGRELTGDQLRDADVLLVRSVTQVNAGLLAEAKKLKFVGSATIGTDHVDLQRLDDLEIPFAHAPGCNAEAVVDYVVSALWRISQRLNRELKTIKAGVVGCGQVGSRLVGRLERLGLEVITCDPLRAEQDLAFKHTSLDELLAECDFISLHTPLTHSGPHATHHLLDRAQLELIKPNALLLNAGRGAVINESALCDYLDSGALVHLVLDVWEHEPEVDARLVRACQIATPHIAGYSLEGKIRGTWMLYLQFCQTLGIEPTLKLESLLPEPALSEISAEGELDPGAIMSLVYDLESDDQRFREALWEHQEDYLDQVAQFDQLRRYYPTRREFSSLTLSELPDAQKALFAGLGFVVGASAH